MAQPVSPASGAPASPAEWPYLAAVRTHTDNILNHGRDVYGPKHTPLFIDELPLPAAVARAKPWRFNQRGGNDVILANVAKQQQFFRVLDGLTTLTDRARYRAAAVEAMSYAFANLADATGLLRWGGHCAYDALGDDWVGYVPGTHELKCAYPHYALMHQVDPAACRRFIEAFWNAHVYDWAVLDFSRHGDFDKPMGPPWNHRYVGRDVWFTGRGLTFINTGSDLIYAAATLAHLTGDERPLVWAKRLNHRYDQTRDPVTGMSGYQFTIRYLPGSDTWTDRAIHQLSGTLAGHVVREGTVSTPRMIKTICARAGVIRMLLSEMLGGNGTEFARSALEDLLAYGRWAYRPAENIFHAIHTDGTVLTGMVFEKDGYYGPAGWAFRSRPGDCQHFLAYAMAYRLSEDAFIWQMVADLARGNGLGEFGRQPAAPAVNLATDCDKSHAVLGLLQLHRATGAAAYLDLARRVADNILAKRFTDGYFVSEHDPQATWLLSEDPVALLHLSAALAGREAELPPIVPTPVELIPRLDGRELPRDEWDARSPGRD